MRTTKSNVEVKAEIVVPESKVMEVTTEMEEIALNYANLGALELKAVDTTFVVPTEKINCSSVARRLIWQGWTNAEVWAVIQKQFNLSESKKHYPAWYRSEQKALIRKMMAA